MAAPSTSLRAIFAGLAILASNSAPGAPWGGAPRPLDAELQAMAPPDCLFFASYAGVQAANPQSTNQTEQLFAEPQVVRFIDELGTQITVGLQRAAAGDPQKSDALSRIPELITALVQCPMIAYLEEVQIEPKRVVAALVLRAGEHRATIAEGIDALLKLDNKSGLQVTTESIGGVTWRRITGNPSAPPVRWGWRGDDFFFAVGEETPVRLLQPGGSNPPAWLVETRSDHPLQRELSLGYVNVAKILQLAQPEILKEEPQAWGVIEKLGLTHLRVIHGVSGYDDVACRSYAHVVTDGTREGLFAFLPKLTLGDADLQLIPRDASIALAMKTDPVDCWREAMALAVQFDPAAEEKVNAVLSAAEAQAGFNVRRDLIEALGDSWIAYLPSGDLLTSWLNLAVAVKAKDASSLLRVSDAVVSRLEADPNVRGKVVFNRSTSDDLTIFSTQFPGGGSPVAPSWGVSQEWVAFALSPAPVRGALLRRGDDSLASAETVKQRLAEGAPAALAYQDTPQLFRSVYPWLTMGAQVAANQLRQVGVTFDPASLPTQDAILRHLRPGLATMSVVDDGLLFETRGSLPGGGVLSAANPTSAGVGVALLLPAVQAAREAARRNTSMNNMKQLMLGMFNYESIKRRFPAYANFSDEGKPLLSWRVHILPYVEQQALYEQFHLDEPWDSPHNKTLIGKMPPIFLDPSSSLSLEDGKTSYLGVQGEHCVFSGDKEGIRLAEITDGTSNTIALLQAPDKLAETWTKPADWEFDAARPTRGLGGPHPGIWLAGRADGSVTVISQGIDAEAFKAMLTTDGGEPVNY